MLPSLHQNLHQSERKIQQNIVKKWQNSKIPLTVSVSYGNIQYDMKRGSRGSPQ